MPDYAIEQDETPYELPKELNIEIMIDTLAESHGVSKRIVENEYTKYDYNILITRKNLEVAKQKWSMEKGK